MFQWKLVLVSLIYCYIFTSTSGETTETRLQVSVYYEALCPDSIRFITNQFYPSFKSLGEYLDPELVPFGKAKASNASGRWEFSCQHGPNECHGNKVQSCSLALFPSSQSVEFVNCVMGSEDPSSDSISKECSERVRIPYKSLQECLRSGQADKLLAINGLKTGDVSPKITYIPTVIFNRVYDEDLQREAEHDFLKVACRLLANKPNVCNTVDVSVDLLN